MNNKIQKVNELCYGKFISLYDLEYKNKLNENKHWTVATRKDKEAVEDFYLNQNEDKVDAVGICAYHVRYKKLVIIKQFRVPINDYIYEVPAGLVDKGDKDILESVKRELKEETGAVDFNIKPVCVYSVKGKTRVNDNATKESFGMLYAAEIFSFEEIHSEIEKIVLSDDLIRQWTYPLIQPKLISEAKKRGYL